MTTNKKVGVIISVYNGENYLAAAIESVLNQTYQSHNLIIINDGSNDKSFEVLKKYEKYILLIEQNNSGQAVSFNKGLKLDSSEYVSFLDADDIWPSYKLQKEVEFLNSNKQIEIITGLTANFKGLELKQQIFHPIKGFMLSASLIRKKVFQKIGGFTEETGTNHILDFYSRCQLNNIKTCYYNEIALFRRVHTANMTLIRKDEIYKGYINALQRHIAKLKK